MAEVVFDADKFRKHVKEAFRRVAEEAAQDIQNAYELSIDEFYKSYEPRRYRRTYSTYKASSGYGKNGKNLVIQTGEYAYEAGIMVNPSYIPGTPYYHYVNGVKTPQDTGFIFGNTFDEGLHGFQGYKYKQSISSNWKDKKGNSITWRHKQRWYYGNKERTTSPKEQMDRRFKDILKTVETKINRAMYEFI